MKKGFKRFLASFIAACLAATAVMFAACQPDGGKNNGGDDSDPTANGYAITVLYPDDTPVKPNDAGGGRKQVGVQLQDTDGKDISNAFSNLNDGGVAVINYKVSGVFLIDIYNIPAGFKYEKVRTVAGKGNYTVKLSAIPIDYKVTVNMPDGTPASGLNVSLMKDSAVVGSASLTSGVASFPAITAGSYDVKLSGLPQGTGYIPAKVTANNNQIVVNLISISLLTLDTVMTEDKLAEWDKIANVYDSPSVIRFDKTADCYDFTTETIPEGKKIYYEFTADEDGTYNFIVQGQYYNVEFFRGEIGTPEITINNTHEHYKNCEMVPITLKTGEKCIFSFAIPPRDTSDKDNPDDHELSGTRNFMIAKPVAGAVTHNISTTGTHTLTFDVDTAILAFKTPDKSTPIDQPPAVSDGGIYEITSDSDLFDLKIEYYPFFNDSASPEKVEDDISETNKNFKFTLEVPPSMSGNTYYFKVRIKSRLDGGDIVYPSQAHITIVRTGNATDNFSPKLDMSATATEKYATQSGTFTFLPHDGNFQIAKDGDKYTVTIDGHTYDLAVAITKTIRGISYSYSTVEYFGEGGRPSGPDDSGSGSGSGDDELPDKPSAERQNTKLTLYSDVSKGEDKDNPKYNYTPFIEAYSKLCNADGVYLVNEELKTFLERYNAQHGADLLFALEGLVDEQMPAGYKTQWWLACGYYA